ncbi:hypothetical protein AQUCO_10200021v1 [Aquilegia coerulea]|uniref:Uncharacterized protein n=1 Tax=Aquilegia coerulea TaxID=218851 RepID=A0A2G5C3T6_AQUCA|nr:hypothetical protein AQUCO_10200021v1 [Aquilegia coerulea]
MNYILVLLYPRRKKKLIYFSLYVNIFPTLLHSLGGCCMDIKSQCYSTDYIIKFLQQHSEGWIKSHEQTSMFLDEVVKCDLCEVHSTIMI